MSANGQSVWDIITNGWRRTVSKFGSSGTLYVSIPRDVANENGIEQGDDVALREPDDDRCDLELHFNNDDG